MRRVLFVHHVVHSDALRTLRAAGFNLLECPEDPTTTDYAVVKIVLDELKRHVKEGHCDKFLSVEERSKFMKLGCPPVKRVITANYGSVKLELKVFAHYTGITLFILDPFDETVQGTNNTGHRIGVFDVNPHITYIVGARGARLKCAPPPSTTPPTPPTPTLHSLLRLSPLNPPVNSPLTVSVVCASQATRYESLPYEVDENARGCS